VDTVADEIGGRAVELDVSSPSSIAEVLGEVGPVDVLVNNAGIGGAASSFFSESPPGGWGVFRGEPRRPSPRLRAGPARRRQRGGGRIVNVASGAAYLPSGGGGGSTAYGPSKAALHRFSEVLAGQLAPHGVFVFSISPGLVRTAMTEHFGDDAPWTPPECAPTL